jgi:hypothetical protein
MISQQNDLALGFHATRMARNAAVESTAAVPAGFVE